MEDKMGLSNVSEKVEVAVIEMEIEKEATTPNISNPKLGALSITVPLPVHVSNPINAINDSRNSSTPSKDTSKAAWLVLCGTILVQGTLFSFPLTFGVFQDFFGRHPDFSNPTQSVWIGVLSTGGPFLGAPFMTALCQAYPQIQYRYYVAVGWAICVASLVGASFSKSFLPLALTQGVLYGFGLLIMDVPALMILNTWFVKRRGTAYGLLFGITDFMGFGATLLADKLLRDHGLKRTLIAFACILLGVCGPSMCLLRPRPTDASTPVMSNQDDEDTILTPLTHRAPSNLCPAVAVRYYRQPVFYIFATANLFHSLAFYLPFIYLPSYATSLGYSATRGAYLLAAANFAQIFGEIVFGQLSDRVNIHFLVLASSVVSSVTVLTFWGYVHSLVGLACFAFIFGSFGSGFISLWAQMGTFFGQKDAQMIYSVMSFGRGLASIASGPISSALLVAAASRPRAEDGSSSYGNGKYLGIVLFVGLSMAISSLIGMMGLFASWHQKELRTVNTKSQGS